MNILEIVKDNIARFSCYREGELFYEVIDTSEIVICMFPINIRDTKDIGSAVFNAEHKAITLMRYIRLAKKNETLVMYK